MFLKKIITSNLKFLKRQASSALYITGDKAQETFSVLTPHIDFDEQLKNKNKIAENLKLRGIETNLDELISVWIFYKKFLKKKGELEEAKSNIAKSVKLLSAEKDKNEIEKLMTHGKMIKSDLKALRESFYSVEESAMTKVLSLPNILHEKTPLCDSEVIFSTDTVINKNESEHHLKIANRLDLVEVLNNSSYYLKNDAALFELGSTFYFADYLLNKNYIEFSNSDFARSVVVEGCGIDYSDQDKVFTIMESDSDHKHENSRLHLTGGATLTSFMAYYTKHVVFPTHLPLKLFTIGRKYTPSKSFSLLNAQQETCVDIFIATKDNLNDMNFEIDNLIKNIIEIYDSLGYDFRLSYLPANKLNNYESMRVSIEMYSCFLKRFVEIGYISVIDNYVSKRLLFNYGTGYNMSFPKVLYGTVLSVPKILACILENNGTILHDKYKKYFS